PTEPLGSAERIHTFYRGDNMGCPQIGLAVLVAEFGNYLVNQPRCESEPGPRFLSQSNPGSESPHPVTQLPREFSHAGSLGSFKTDCEQITEFGVIEPLLMEDLR